MTSYTSMKVKKLKLYVIILMNLSNIMLEEARHKREIQ